jgi:hypothetical protein
MTENQAPQHDDAFICIACEQPIKPGDLVYTEINSEYIHAACVNNDRDFFCDDDGRVLAEGEPIPEPFVFTDEKEG